MPHCDHKFIDSKACLKCGWVPPPRLVLTNPTPPPIFDADELRAMALEAESALMNATYGVGVKRVRAMRELLPPRVVLALLDERATLLARVEAVRVAVERAKHDWNEGIGPIGALVNLIEELEKI